jgi:hypothetical protein
MKKIVMGDIMSTGISIGILFLVIGIVLFPIGIMYLKQNFEEYKELTPIKKILVLIVGIIDLFTTPILSAWIIYISLIFIIFGTALLVLT